MMDYSFFHCLPPNQNVVGFFIHQELTKYKNIIPKIILNSYYRIYFPLPLYSLNISQGKFSMLYALLLNYKNYLNVSSREKIN